MGKGLKRGHYTRYGSLLSCHRPVDSVNFRRIRKVGPVFLIEPEDSSNIDLCSKLLDDFQRHQIAATCTWAFTFRLTPCLFGLQVRPPEGPVAALPGASRIDTAAACLWVKERAVAVGVLGQRQSSSCLTSVKKSYLAVRNPQAFSNLLNLVLINPHIARLTSAAVATLGALELQSGCIPRILRRG